MYVSVEEGGGVLRRVGRLVFATKIALSVLRVSIRNLFFCM